MSWARLWLLCFEEQCRQWGKRQLQREWTAVNGNLLGIHAAEVAHAAAGVLAGIAVEHFTPVSTVGDADAVADPRHRREIARDQNRVLRRRALAQQRNRA